VRIIAGRWKGHPITAPRGATTRPTTDRVREAVFSAVYSMLGPLDGLRVADFFAGSGALGLEALSRGASAVTFVEREYAAIKALRSNIESLGARASARVVSADATSSAVPGRLGGPFALLFFDPPYRIDATEVVQVLVDLAESGGVASGALVVYEHAAGVRLFWPRGFLEVGTKRYGDTAVSFAIYEK